MESITIYPKNGPELHERLLNLEGGNNFRDLGGYITREGRPVKRGLLYRSGVMTGLTTADQQKLNSLNIKTIVDLRSREEIELFPNHWASTHRLNFVCHDYSIDEISSTIFDENGNRLGTHHLYQRFPAILRTQLTLLFNHMLEGADPLVFNCSAGQDRTGFAAALILDILGVPWDTILEDYHLSTVCRRPELETAGIDFNDHAQTNLFAQTVLRYGNSSKTPEPLFTENQESYLDFSFHQIKQSYGSVTEYLSAEIGVDNKAIDELKARYLDD